MEDYNEFEDCDCEEFDQNEDIPEQDNCMKKRDNKHKRKWKHKKRLEKLADNASKYPAGAHRVDKNNEYTDDPEETKYVKRDYRSQTSSYLKKLASKKFRRYKGDLPNGGTYKKTFDYWWELT